MPKQAWFTLIFIALILTIFGLPITIIGIRDQLFYMALLGIGLLAIPLMMIAIPLRKKAIQRQVRAQGALIQARFIQVRLAEYAINNYRPYIILSQWHDPIRNVIYRFKSEAIPFDPTPYIPKGDSIPVWISPKNPKRYAVDLQQIPRLANKLKRRSAS